MKEKSFHSKLSDWYDRNKRSLPWRDTRDPYKIWLSEIILQQTRVEQGLPYYNRFLEVFPNLYELANAPQDKVLREWQGLGYYSRARNLHDCAIFIVHKLNGIFPNSFEELKQLKGVGQYTAAAIASFAFNEPVPAVDGNVMRVLSRYFGLEWDLSAGESKKKFFDKAKELISVKDPGKFNQALMEFGAIQCKPINPECWVCPFKAECRALADGLVKVLPVKTKRQSKKEVFFNYLVIESDSKLFMRQRTDSIWRGLFEFPLFESENKLKTNELKRLINSHLTKEYEYLESSEEKIHLLSHRKIRALFHRISVPSGNIPANLEQAGTKAYTLDEIKLLPKSVLMNNYLIEYYF